MAQSGSAPALGAGGRRFKSSRPDHGAIRGCSSMVELQPSKLAMGVRFPSPALSPIGAIERLSEGDAQKPSLSRRCDLAENKFVRIAQAGVRLSAPR